MKLDQFLQNLADLLGASTAEVRLGAPLESLAGWDSMGQLSTLSLLDEIGVRPPKGSLQQCKSVSDLVALAGAKIEQ